MKRTELWELFETAFKKSFGFSFISVENIIRTVEKSKIDINWKCLTDWESLDDIDIYNELNQLHKIVSEEVYVITDASYYNYGPIKINGDKLSDFVTSYFATYQECFFNLEVAIISLKTREIWVFHHEGVFAYIPNL